MSNSAMLDTDQDSASVTFAQLDDEFFNDPSLGISSNEGPFALPESSSNVPSSNNDGASLLERIQQQRNQQNSAIPPRVDQSQQASSFSGANVQAPASSENPFGYPVVGDTNFYSSPVSAPDPNGNIPMNIPDYATSSSLPNSYEASDSDYKDKMFNFLAATGNATSSAAKGIYRGTKNIYGNLMNKRTSTGLLSQQERMAEMDYQRQSLLMDPHEVEDGIPNTSSMDAGLRAGFDNPEFNSANAGHPVVVYGKQFLVDLKDIFLGLSRRAQLIVILFLVFIIWLFISEEWSHGHDVRR